MIHRPSISYTSPFHDTKTRTSLSNQFEKILQALLTRSPLWNTSYTTSKHQNYVTMLNHASCFSQQHLLHFGWTLTAQQVDPSCSLMAMSNWIWLGCLTPMDVKIGGGPLQEPFCCLSQPMGFNGQPAHGKTLKKILPGAWKWAGLKGPNINWQQCHVVCWDSKVKILNPILVTTASWEQVSKSTNKNRHMEITKSRVTLSCYQLWLLVGFINPASCWSFISMSVSPSSHGLSSLLAKSWHCRTSWLQITKVEGGQQRLKGDSKERCHHDAICTTWRHGSVVFVEFAIHKLSEMICLRLML